MSFYRDATNILEQNNIATDTDTKLNELKERKKAKHLRSIVDGNNV